MLGTDATFPLCVATSSKLPADPFSKVFKKSRPLALNRPYDQLSARTPPAIVDPDVLANAAPSTLSKFRRPRSAHTPPLFVSTLFSLLQIAFCKIRPSQDCPHLRSLDCRVKPFAFILFQTLCRCEKHQPVWNQANPNSFAKTPGVGYSQPLRTSATGQVAHPLFSWSYKLLFPQALFFDKHLRCPRGWGLPPQNCSRGVESCPCPRSSAPTTRRTFPRSTSSTRPASLPASPTRKPLCGTSSRSAPRTA